MEINAMLSTRNVPAAVLGGALLLAVIHQYLFFGHAAGVSYPIFAIFFYAFVYRNAKDGLRRMTGFGWLLAGCILLLSLTFALFDNPFFGALNMIAVPMLISIHLAYLLGWRRLEWWDLRLAANALEHLFPQTLGHFPTVFRTLKSAADRKMGDRRKSALFKVLTGLAVALPLLLVVISLLSSADGVFGHMLAGIPEWLDGLSFREGIVRLLWAGLFTLLFCSYLWGFVSPNRKDREPHGREESEERRGFRIDPIVSATVLISVNAVYVLFVAIQFTYLFGAWEGTLPDGKSYAEYARSGFFELVAVTSLNYLLLMGALLRGEEGSGALRIAGRSMLYLLVGCSGVMLYSAYMRLALYEEAYGYTYIRFLVHAFMIFLALLLIIAGARIRLHRLPLAKCYIVLALVAYVTVNYAGMDRIIAHKNIERYRETGQLDADYLTALSADAVPALVRFAKEEYPDLGGRLQAKREELSSRDRGWQAFNLSRWLAERALPEATAAP